MAISIISSWGGMLDTVYALVDDAEEYLGSSTIIGYKVDPSPWTLLSSIQKCRYLLAATRDVDNAAHYVGERQFIDQTLEFPRVPAGESRWPWVNRALTEANTYNIYLTEQKRRVKQATIEQAYSLIVQGERNEHIERRLSGITSYSESIGPLSESASYGGSVMPLCPEAMELLNPYLGGGLELIRG